jgi:hypothetical protein
MMYIIGSTLLALYVLWVAYVAVMHLDKINHEQGLNLPSKVLGYPLLVAAFVLDIALNWIVFTVLFLELPQELTVSHRLKRWNRTQTGYRKWLIVHIFEPLLDPYDKRGNHI